MKKICILDYGLGNIKSLYNSLKKIGFNAQFFSENSSSNYDILFIPGVGSFSHASKLIKDKKLDEYLIKAKKNSYIFGICLGMQILLSKGFENGKHDGLNLINGEVKLIRNNANKIILPIVGSKKIIMKNNKIKSLNQYNNEMFYFVHSYVAHPIEKSNILCQTSAQNIDYCSGIIKDNIIGTQFHPEKSG
jgi:glutamine amidotransferase